MASQTGKWREEQILILCPGSQTTMAQLGCSELTPPTYRIPTRMFRDPDADADDEAAWRPYATVKRKKVFAPGETPRNEEDEWEYVEEPDSVEDAVYPIQGGHIVNMEALLAFLDHVHGMLTTTYHNTPIVLMASPQWTRPDVETIVRYVFERTKTPALCLLHSGIATQYGLKWPNMTVVDIGFEKVDVTCIYDGRIVSQRDVNGLPDNERDISGGEVFTMRLLEMLEKKGFDYDLAEQLKKSPICEVLPYDPNAPALMDLPEEILSPTAEALKAAADGEDDGTNGEMVVDEGVLDVANIVSGNTREFLAKKEKERLEKTKGGRRGKDRDAEPAKPIRLPNSKRLRNTFHYDDVVTEEVTPEPPAPQAPAAPAAPAPTQENGANDVDMAGTAATNGTAPAAPAPAEEVKPAEGNAPKEEANGAQPAATEELPKPEAPTDDPPKLEAPAEEAPKPVAPEEAPAAPVSEKAPVPETVPVPDTAPAPEAASAPAAPAEPEQRTKRVRRDIEVGLERFTFADRSEIDRVATAIYRAVQGVDDMYMRPQCWENIVFVGNGARLRGLKENIMQTLQARYLISPSTATMFTSELPSNLGTPSGTGSQTPTGSFVGGPPHQLPTASGGVNPLLQAATTAAGLAVPGGAVPGAPGSNAGDGAVMPSHHFHSQTPTAIKLAPLPTYLSEWTKHGFEEAMFLGAQVAARLAFCVHNLDMQGLESQRLMSLNRVEYNELGPKGIRSHSMLGW